MRGPSHSRSCFLSSRGLFFGAIPALQICPHSASTPLLGAARTASASRERQRGTQLAGCCPGRHGAGAAGQRGADDPHLCWPCAMSSPGFTDPASLQTMRLSIPETLVRDSTTVARMQNSIVDKLAAIPGVSSAGFTASVPMDGTEPNWDDIFLEGIVYEGGGAPMRLYNFVSPGLLPYHRHTVCCWPRLHLDGHLWPAGLSGSSLKALPASCGAPPRLPSASGSGNEQPCPGRK